MKGGLDSGSICSGINEGESTFFVSRRACVHLCVNRVAMVSDLLKDEGESTLFVGRRVRVRL